ncbi:MAG: glycosyltransferase family 2 protein [Ruminococcaceae bacterium]|nr:glycosyltransferase family 2 protein [Oscillospiraceae bacterium]
MATITVFTPAYNRAHTLIRTYESLLNQNNKDFIWLIVDDGSTDNTAELVKSWQANDNGFEIRYLYKENGGMHTAHNVAYEHIDTELNVCIDSDDMLAERAIEIILLKWNEVSKYNYAGIVGLDSDFNGKILGTTFPDGITETTLSGYYANGGSGDKKLVYRTDIIKSTPEYPVFEGEKYVALAYKYRLIDQEYKLATLNEVLCHVEYQADGSSNTMYRQYVKNPKGFAFWRKICMQFPTSKKRLIIDNIHYVSSCILAKRLFKGITESPCPFYSVLSILPGALLAVYSLHKAKH